MFGRYPLGSAYYGRSPANPVIVAIRSIPGLVTGLQALSGALRLSSVTAPLGVRLATVTHRLASTDPTQTLTAPTAHRMEAIDDL